MFGFAAKAATKTFCDVQQSSYNALIYQPFGYALGGGLYGLLSTGFQLETAPLGVLWAFLTGLFLGLGLIFRPRGHSS